MSAYELFAWTSIMLFGLGLYGVMAQRHLLRKVISLNVMSSAVFLFLISTAAREPTVAVDPVPHAMVLTGIVVSVSATALALSLVRRIHHETGETGLQQAEPSGSKADTSQ